VYAAAVCLLLASNAFAGTTGKLTGVVRSEKKEPLPGVNIRVVGQRLGAISDETGHFTILGIPAGEISVQASLIGYTAQNIEKVGITPDFTTELNINLQSEAVQMQEVKVEATRPLLQKDATGTTRFLTADDIQRMPTRGYKARRGAAVGHRELPAQHRP
jgi:iron complex outermembrane receptor protein